MRTNLVHAAQFHCLLKKNPWILFVFALLSACTLQTIEVPLVTSKPTNYYQENTNTPASSLTSTPLPEQTPTSLPEQTPTSPRLQLPPTKVAETVVVGDRVVYNEDKYSFSVPSKWQVFVRWDEKDLPRDSVAIIKRLNFIGEDIYLDIDRYNLRGLIFEDWMKDYQSVITGFISDSTPNSQVDGKPAYAEYGGGLNTYLIVFWPEGDYVIAATSASPTQQGLASFIEVLNSFQSADKPGNTEIPTSILNMIPSNNQS
jgi:hypothetical protein